MKKYRFTDMVPKQWKINTIQEVVMEKDVDIGFGDDDIKRVRKHNFLIDGRYRFGVNEQKIMLTIISKVRYEDKKLLRYKVSFSEIKKISKGRISTEKKILDVCKSLKNKNITIRKGPELDFFGCISGAKINVDKKYVEFRLDPSLKDLLVDLVEGGNFTIYDLECAMSLGSAHSIRIYEILKSVEWQGPYVEISLASLRWSLDIPEESYKDFGNFRRSVLEKAQQDLNKHTDMAFNFQTIKSGRSVVAIQFHLNKKKLRQKTIQAQQAKDSIDRLQVGDKVNLAGKEYEVMSGGVLLDDGAIPLGRLQELFHDGKVKRID